MAFGIEIAPITVRILEQQLQLNRELEEGLARSQDRGQPGVRGLPVSPGLEQGEVISARVLENLGANRYLVLIKGIPFIADSQISLESGSEITVRVERPAPDIRLALVQSSTENPETQAGRNVINEYLKWQRTNPDGIKNLLTELAERLDTPQTRISQNPPDLLTRLSPESAVRLLSLLKRLQYGGGNQDNNWVRNYARDLGLTVESELLKNLASGTALLSRVKGHPDLKSALMEIAVLIQAENAAVPGAADPGGMKALSALVDSGIKNIEALQVSNVVLQDSQGACAFQAPIVFQGSRGLAHLFIEGDGQEGAAGKGAVHKILLLLDFDSLGAMRVVASLAEGRIDCLFRCESSVARDLVLEGLDSLKKALEAAGCRVSNLGCFTDTNIRQENQVSLNERLVGGESLSLFA